MGLFDKIPIIGPILKFTPIGQGFRVVSTVMTIATFITMATPTKSDDRIVANIQKILNICAGNIFHNENKDTLPNEVLDHVDGGNVIGFLKELKDVFGG